MTVQSRTVAVIPQFEILPRGATEGLQHPGATDCSAP